MLWNGQVGWTAMVAEAAASCPGRGAARNVVPQTRDPAFKRTGERRTAVFFQECTIVALAFATPTNSRLQYGSTGTAIESDL